MDELVEQLSKGEHHVDVSLRPQRTGLALKESIGRGYVQIRFTETRGGTEIGIPLDPEASDWSAADFDAATGHARFVGRLVINYVPVTCIAEIDLATWEGTGHLEPIVVPTVSPDLA